VLSLCYEQNSSNCLSECGLSVYYNFNVFSNAVDFIALTPLMIRAWIQDGGLWIQCTVYVVKNILNFTKVILVLIKSKDSFSYIKGHAVHLKDISNRIGIINQRGRGVKVQNWPHIILKNNARHRIKTIY
jgi:hypothetical protein